MHVMTRSAMPVDAPVIAELLHELGYPSETSAVRRRMDNLLARPDYYIAVAEHQSKPCGLGVLHIYQTLHADGSSALICALVVSSSVRGKGVGRMIVADLEARAREIGCRRIMVTTATHRADAHSFYERLAYDFTGRRYAKEL